jgi:hypothetical protein
MTPRYQLPAIVHSKAGNKVIIITVDRFVFVMRKGIMPVFYTSIVSRSLIGKGGEQRITL